MTRITHGPYMHRDDPWKLSVRAATTANVTISTALNNGDTLDGVTLVSGDRVLVKDQSAGSQNGIYVVGSSPARAEDYDTQGDVLGSVVVVQQGSTNADTAWMCTTNAPFTVGTDALAFTAFGTGGGASLRVKEIDGSPDVSPVTEIQVTNGTLTDNGGGSVTLTITGGGSAQFDVDSNKYRLPSGGGIDTIAQEDVAGTTDARILLSDGYLELNALDGAGAQAQVIVDGNNGYLSLIAWSTLVEILANTGINLSLSTGLVQMVGGEGMRVPELSADPGSPIENQTYYNTTTHKMRTYDGTSWQDHW